MVEFQRLCFTFSSQCSSNNFNFRRSSPLTLKRLFFSAGSFSRSKRYSFMLSPSCSRIYFREPSLTAFLVLSPLRARQKSVRFWIGLLVSIALKISIPSNGRSFGGLVPAALTIDLEKSKVIQVWFDTLLAGITPGHFTMHGTLMPPSKRFPL